jgi:anti-repressor protein
MNNLPVIAGVEIFVDSEGRYNLNALHKASKEGQGKDPAHFLRLKSAKEFIAEVDIQISISPIVSKKGGQEQGTFATN